MTVLDVVMIVITGFCLIRGIFRGLIKEISSIVGVLAGYYAAYTYYGYPAKLLSQWLSNSGYINLLSFFIIFCLVFLIISILGVIIKYLLSISHLGWADRISGAVFGLTKGILIAAILLLAGLAAAVTFAVAANSLADEQYVVTIGREATVLGGRIEQDALGRAGLARRHV